MISAVATLGRQHKASVRQAGQLLHDQVMAGQITQFPPLKKMAESAFVPAQPEKERAVHAGKYECCQTSSQPGPVTGGPLSHSLRAHLVCVPMWVCVCV